MCCGNDSYLNYLHSEFKACKKNLFANLGNKTVAANPLIAARSDGRKHRDPPTANRGMRLFILHIKAVKSCYCTNVRPVRSFSQCRLPDRRIVSSVIYPSAPSVELHAAPAAVALR